MDEWDRIWKEEFSFEKDYRSTIDNLASYHFLGERLKGRKGQKILEVGCGTGLTSLLLAKKYELRPYLLDSSSESVKLCAKNARKLKIKAIVKKAYAQKLPFPDDYFDICFSGGLIEHLLKTDRLKALREMVRVSKDLVIVIAPNARNIPYRIGKFWRERAGRWIYGHEKPLSRSEFKSLVEKCDNVKSYEIIGLKFKESLAWPLPKADKFAKLLKGKSVLDRFGCELALIVKKKV